MELSLYDDHTKPHDEATIPQITLFIVWICATFLWLCQLPWFRQRQNQSSPDCEKCAVSETLVETSPASAADNDNSKEVHAASPEDHRPKSGQDGANTDAPAKTFSAVKPPTTLHDFLTTVIILGIFMLYFYLCDYKKIFAKSERLYSRDTFLFLIFILFLVSICMSIKDTSDKILNRDQTEEWKGWMQVLFVWYHYFAAKEWYNWIRMYIAAYVWMTGFGNFSFFYVRKDFSLWRVLKMLFRLNFMVVLVCASVSNEYALYYICPMHTYWFLSVYAMMAVFPSWNTHRGKILVKFAAYAIANALIFDVPGVAVVVFRPFWFFLGLNDGKSDIMHEWAFRSGLDHWVAFIGMLCAYNYPHYESFLLWVEAKSNNGRPQLVGIIKGAMVTVTVGVYLIWHHFVLPLDKFAYNRVHPYTSFIPILTYIILRNIHPLLRKKYVFIFSWLGKVTLETYLSQLHVFLQSNAKHLIEFLPGYPLLNFSFSTVIYMGISYKMFHLTTDASAFLFPQDKQTLVRKLLSTGLVFVIAGILAWLLKLTVLSG